MVMGHDTSVGVLGTILVVRTYQVNFQMAWQQNAALALKGGSVAMAVQSPVQMVSMQTDVAIRCSLSTLYVAIHCVYY